jgi:hypothetical protein
MWNSGIFNTGILITRTFLYITEDFWKFEDKAARGKEDDGVDVLAAPAEQHGARRTSAKSKDIAAVISSRLAGESPVSFAFFSAVKARKLQAPIFARQLACAVAQRKLVLTRADQHKIKGQ